MKSRFTINFKNSLRMLLLSLAITAAGLSSSLVNASSYGSDKPFEEYMAQFPERNISGIVTDSSGEPVVGATVTIMGKAGGVITDLHGKFALAAADGNVLEIACLGFETLTVPVDGKNEFVIVMQEKADELEEVTVVAFARQRKESVIGAISTVSPKELNIPSSDLTSAFAGKIGGMIAYQRSGEPGVDNTEFFIRGVTTFGYKKDPLILLDGNEISSSDLSRIQPDDIASFSIMKDATASALYGSRGANGVILITTKEGTEGTVKVNLRLESSFSMPTSDLELADPVTYMILHNEAVSTRDPKGIRYYTQQKIDNTIAGGHPYVYPATDWQEMLFKDFTNNTRANLSISGGGKIARYYISATLNHDTGVLKSDGKNNFNNNINLKKYSFRSNVNILATKTTDIIMRLQGSFDDYNGPVVSGDDLYTLVMKSNPVLFPAYYEPDEANIHTRHILFGNYDKAQYNNPYAQMTRGYRDYSRSQIFAQFEINQKLDFVTKGLQLRAMFNTTRYSFFQVSRAYTPFFYNIDSYDKATGTYTLKPLNEKEGTEYLSVWGSQNGKDIQTTTYLEASLSWDRIFAEKHSVSALLVMTLRNHLSGYTGEDLQKTLPYRNLGYAGRFTYSYGSRYFIEANFGYNGSERFAEKERFGFFPSIGAGWIVSNENFWEPLKKTISKLKFKATYGLVGNDAIGDPNDRFFYLSNVNMDDANKATYFGTYGNSGGEYENGISISRYSSDQITWETSYKLNLGVEIELWKKLEIQADYFTDYRTNILMNRYSIPSTMGLQSVVRANVGEAKTHGVDISVNYNHVFNRNLWISALCNFTYATNEYVVFEEPDYSDAPWHLNVGNSLTQNWGYIAERLFVDDEDVRNSPIQFGDYMAGDIKYKDINNDGVINDLDIVPIGYPGSPEIVYGFGVSFGYKQFDISCFFQGLARESFAIIPYNENVGIAPFLDGQQALLQVIADSHWSESNRDVYAFWPRLADQVIDNNDKSSTWWLRDGSFIRLKSLEIGYSIPRRIVNKIRLKELRVYASGINLLYFSKFKLWDPEMAGAGMRYPIQKVYNIGLQLTF